MCRYLPRNDRFVSGHARKIDAFCRAAGLLSLSRKSRRSSLDNQNTWDTLFLPFPPPPFSPAETLRRLIYIRVSYRDSFLSFCQRDRFFFPCSLVRKDREGEKGRVVGGGEPGGLG